MGAREETKRCGFGQRMPIIPHPSASVECSFRSKGVYKERDERGAEDSTREQGDIDTVVGGHLGVQVPNRLDMLLSHAQVGDLA